MYFRSAYFTYRRALVLLTLGSLCLLGNVHTAVAQDALSIYFSYHQDIELQYLDKLNQWQARYHRIPSLLIKEQLAREADATSNTNHSAPKRFTEWRYQGGPKPPVFQARLHWINPSGQVQLNNNFQVSVYATIGELRADPQILVTDYAHLQQSSRKTPLLSFIKQVPALAPYEELDEALFSFELYRFLRFHPTEWPTNVIVEMTPLNTNGKAKRKPVSQQLKLLPDHFILPEESGEQDENL